jgi:outer membrane biogenesis lipoprotein LolB
MKIFVIFSTALLLLACSSTQNQWVKNGSDAQAFEKASQACKVKSESQYQTMAQQVVISYENCMQAQGWEKTPH